MQKPSDMMLLTFALMTCMALCAHAYRLPEVEDPYPESLQGGMSGYPPEQYKQDNVERLRQILQVIRQLSPSEMARRTSSSSERIPNGDSLQDQDSADWARSKNEVEKRFNGHERRSRKQKRNRQCYWNVVSCY